MQARRVAALTVVIERMTGGVRVGAMLLMAGMLAAAPRWAAPATPPSQPAQAGTEAAAPGESAVWVPKELTFDYRQLTTRYSCDGLQDRMRRILLDLGARSDLQVTGYGCTRLAGPDTLAGVRIKVNVLQPADKQPAGKETGPTVQAHWQNVELPPERDPLRQAGDCELIQQISQQILPLFTTRNVRADTTCVPRQTVPGSTRLTAQVLVADRAPAAAAH